MRGPRFTKRLAVLGSAATLVVGLSACSGDRITDGDRPNAPAAQTMPSTPSTTEPTYLDPDTIPGLPETYTGADDASVKDMLGIRGAVTWQVFDESNQPYDASSDEIISWGNSETYADIDGVLTFRGSPQRDSPTFGTADITEQQLEVVWSKDIGVVEAEGSVFPGAGWTGQPLLVNWPAETKQAMGFTAEQVNDSSFVEVLYPVFDGNIYRLDLQTGEPTTEPINSGFGFKGTGSVDPRGYPLLYAGQGLHEKDGETGEFRYRIFDLTTNQEIGGIPGDDPVSQRTDPVGWGAFDSSGLIDKRTDTLIEAGENGVIYKVKLNSNFDAEAGTVSIDPTVTKMVYDTQISKQRGIEDSPAAWNNLMYASDNDGNLICWDATTLDIVWAQADENADNADATIALDATDEGPMLYTGNSVGWRGYERENQEANLRKVNGLTGETEWEFDVPAYFNWHVKGGLVASPLLGKGEASDLVIFNVARTSAPSEGNLIAIDKETGQVVWNRQLAKYSWSSPVSITATDGKQYGVYGDSAGELHLFNMNTGEDYASVSLGGKNIEASVAAYGNMLVVANYDQKIWGIRVS